MMERELAWAITPGHSLKSTSQSFRKTPQTSRVINQLQIWDSYRDVETSFNFHLTWPAKFRIAPNSA